MPVSAEEAARVGLPRHSGAHSNYSRIVEQKLQRLDRDFANGKFVNNDRQLLERVQSLENEMRSHLLTINGRVN